MKKLLLTIVIASSLLSCKKDQSCCWQVVDCVGNELGAQCDMSQKEMQQYINRLNSGLRCKYTYKLAK